jgi:NDP-sugar pyrophosphorylase family protein
LPTLSAYFLCAGYGRRLAPLTDRIPKPALTFLGKTALEINYRRVMALYPGRLLCNTHHLFAEMEKPALRYGMNILYEKEILGTGGCFHNARHILETTDHFIVHNGDLIHTIDLRDLMARHLAGGRIATLAGIFRPTHNTLVCDEKGRLLGVHNYEGFQEAGATRLTFAGIAIYDKAFLDFCQGGVEDIKKYWVAALRAGKSIAVANYSQDAAWYDFGTPQGLWEAAKFVMEQQGEFSYGYYPLIREARPYVSNEAGQEDLPESLRNVLVYEETHLPLPAHATNCIVGRDFRWDIQP